ncbi:MAG: helix-turn-helix domain-containing protein [Solidesulfovibrio sp.]|uniref:helix-turn-helix domain-containing protein n=1 Tax=Solidesulfovibrio sp. TaxID=2910990 RepID=UPI0031591EC6
MENNNEDQPNGFDAIDQNIEENIESMEDTPNKQEVNEPVEGEHAERGEKLKEASEDLPEYELVENDIDLNFEDLPDASETEQFEDRQPIVDNFIYQGDLVLISADRIIGSTWFLMNLVSQLVEWKSKEQHFVPNVDISSIFVNHTLEFDEILNRFQKCTPPESRDKIKILSNMHLLAKNNLHQIDLSKNFWRNYILSGVKDNPSINLVIIDDFDLLCKTNKSKTDISEWLKEFRKFGKTVIILVKAKNWNSYISSDVIDLELKLSPYESQYALGLRMDIVTSRNVAKEYQRPVLFDMIEQNGNVVMRGKQYQEDITHRIAFLVANGFTQTEIAKSLGINQSTVSRRFDRALNESLLHKQGKQYILSESGLAHTKGMKLPDD